MSLQQRQLGISQIRKLLTSVNNHNLLVNMSSPVLETTKGVANGPSGTVVDPDDPHFTILYSYDGGRINSKDIFIAILEAIAITAEYDDNLPFLSLVTTSASRKCEITISKAPSESQLHYSYVTKVLQMLTWDVFVHLKFFGEMKMQLKLDGQEIAEGHFRAQPGTNENEIAK